MGRGIESLPCGRYLLQQLRSQRLSLGGVCGVQLGALFGVEVYDVLQRSAALGLHLRQRANAHSKANNTSCAFNGWGAEGRAWVVAWCASRRVGEEGVGISSQDTLRATEAQSGDEP